MVRGQAHQERGGWHPCVLGGSPREARRGTASEQVHQRIGCWARVSVNHDVWVEVSNLQVRRRDVVASDHWLLESDNLVGPQICMEVRLQL